MPVELISKILVMAHNISPLSPSIMRVSRACYDIAQPLVYETIRLNRYTLRKITYDMRSDTRPYCAWRFGHRVAKLRAESRARRLYSLQQATTLVIDDIPILFRAKFDDMLRDFCQWVTLPNVTKIIFCQEEGGLWARDEDYEWKDPKDPTELHRRQNLTETRAVLFAKVLTAETKNVCVQIPPEGRFAKMGYINRYWLLVDIPVPHLYTSAPKLQRFSVTTSDRVMEYIEALSGKVNLRIHQDVHGKRNLAHATIPATYVYRSFLPNLGVSDRVQVAQANGLTTLHHLGRFWECQSQNARSNIWATYYHLINTDEKTPASFETHGGHIRRLQQLNLMKGRTQIEAEKEYFKKVYQGVSAMRPDSTTPCPCCKEIDVPL
jgi:hypothetical protein